MVVDEQAIQSAWMRAADDLGIEVVAPATVTVDSETIGAIALLPEFGSALGMVIFGRLIAADTDHGANMKLLRERGFGFSHLGSSYENYDRSLFVDTLNDWGWTGGAEPPGWYTGQPWGA